jgi:hypothetical protein
LFTVLIIFVISEDANFGVRGIWAMAILPAISCASYFYNLKMWEKKEMVNAAREKKPDPAPRA